MTYRTVLNVIGVVVLVGTIAQTNRLAGQAAPGREVLTNDAVVLMVTGKLQKALIVQKIQTTKNEFDVSAKALVGLFASRVPPDVIKVIMKEATGPGVDEVLTNDAVVQMVMGRLPGDIIVAKIQAPTIRPAFDTTAAGLVALKQNKVPEGVIKLMIVTSMSAADAPPAAVAPSPSTMANLSGTWTGTGKDTSGPGDFSCDLTHTGNRMSGKCLMKDPTGASAEGVLNGQFSGSKLTFKIVVAAGSLPKPYDMCEAVLSGVAEFSDRAANGTYDGTNTCTKPFKDGVLTLTRK